jgi:hypothetical protein
VPRPAPAIWQNNIEQPHPQPVNRELESLQDAIRSAFVDADPLIALQRIDEIWTKLDDASNLAESRMRILLKRVAKPPLAPEPDWLAEGLSSLSREVDLETGELPLAAAVESARLLICSVIKACDVPHLRAELGTGLLGSVDVQWNVPSSLTWVVQGARLPWPGLQVRAYARSAPNSTLEVRCFHQAFGAIEHARKYLVDR